jgi:hypothetical protein
MLQDQYVAALKQAQACDPKRTDQCTATVSESLPCGCSTPVNATNTQALAELSNLSMQAAAACPEALCAACEAPPGPPTCSAAGSCQYAVPPSVACKVAGVVYPSGSSGILRPGDCNTCSCLDGELTGCTKKACTPDSACPAGTVASTQCAQCGPTDACEIVEHACLPTCTDSCASGSCADGICRLRCG